MTIEVRGKLVVHHHIRHKAEGAPQERFKGHSKRYLFCADKLLELRIRVRRNPTVVVNTGLQVLDFAIELFPGGLGPKRTEGAPT